MIQNTSVQLSSSHFAAGMREIEIQSIEIIMYYAFFSIGYWPGPFSSPKTLIKIYSVEKVERRSIENTGPAPGMNSPQGPVIPTDFPG